jgi:hypothetical protein
MLSLASMISVSLFMCKYTGVFTMSVILQSLGVDIALAEKSDSAA